MAKPPVVISIAKSPVVAAAAVDAASMRLHSLSGGVDDDG